MTDEPGKPELLATRRAAAFRLAALNPQGGPQALDCAFCRKLLAALGLERECGGAPTCNAAAAAAFARIAALIDPSARLAEEIRSRTGTASGADEPVGWRCPDCGCADIDEENLFCPTCGCPLTFSED